MPSLFHQQQTQKQESQRDVVIIEYTGEGKAMEPGRIEISSSASCWMTLGKLIDLSKTQFHDLYNWNSKTHLVCIWED